MRALKAAGSAGRSSSASRKAAIVAEAVKNASEQSRRTIDLEIADQRENRIALPGLGQRGGGARGQVWPARQRRLNDHVSGRGAVDEVGVGQHGRVLKHRGGGFGLVGRQREDHSARRVVGPAQSHRQRPAHQDRRIVEERGHRQRRFGAQGRGQIGVEIGAGERARPFRPRIRVGGLRPG